MEPKRESDIEQVESLDRMPNAIKFSEIKGDVDAAAVALQNQDLGYTDKESSHVLRKIDWHLLPLMSFACGLQVVDKSGMGAAATYGIRESLNLVGAQYSWCVSIFYFGYLAGSFLSGRGLQYFHAGKFIGVNFTLWGVTLLGCVGAQNYATLLAMRFLLGLFESALLPGFLIVTTMWYTHQEQPFRIGVWTVLNGALPVPFLIIYYGLGTAKHSSLEPWRLIFLLIGLLSTLMGLLLYFFLPDSPMSVSWLNDREKAIAIQRIAKDQTGVKNAHLKWSQVREAVMDYRAWLIVLMMLFSQACGSVTTNFLGIIINGFGFAPLKTQLYTAPNFAVQAVTQVLVSTPPTFFKGWKNTKIWLTIAASSVSLVGLIILYVTPDEEQYASRRLGGVIVISCSGVNQGVILSIIGSNIGGFTKKQIVTSATLVMYCVANIITPQTFLGSESPRYRTGLTFVMCSLCVFIAIAVFTWFSIFFENRHRDRKALTDQSYVSGAMNTDIMSGLRDETDIQNKHHRYSG